MTTFELLEELKKRKIIIYLSEGKIKLKGEEETLTPELIDTIRKYKSELVKYLTERSRNDDQTEWVKYAQWAWTGILLEAERQGDSERAHFAKQVLETI
ncbi:hypothetical protein [Atribacter laminatus]|uniref:TubC N-terminal docking domain-containing protein n=1 Tax=Atribacter laminatus TaxID=2847778 RepID=A0A7T1F3H0_ATRLM|nr:hypothetical protein [Atribacter laminatus]QPM68867.1 hypothetical protein RT761_02094 [Atribacter laminatus]